MKRTIIIFIGILLAFSCAKEVVEPGQTIRGDYVLDDGSGLTDTYVSFKDGIFLCYRANADVKYTLAENTLWGCRSKDFLRTAVSPYTLSGGVLTLLKKTPFESGLVKDGVLYLDGKTFTSLIGFSGEYWSSVSLPDGNLKELDYTAQEVSVPATVVRPIPAGKIDLSVNAGWISGLSFEEGNIRFSVPETDVDAEAKIMLNYTNAASVVLTVTRSPATTILLSETERTIDYAASHQELSYEIDNPLPTSSLALVCDSDWVTNIRVENGKVSFDVAENNAGESRNATFAFSYGGARNVIFSLTQQWSASEITTTPTSQEVAYTGDSFSFDFTIANPREGASVTATSQSDWITDVQLSGNTVSYKVTENNFGSSRTGKIKLTYGSYATTEFSVTQSWSSAAITITPTSQDVAYTGGAYSFDFAVTNPREGASITAVSQSDWITDVQLSGNTVSYKVTENNFGSSRTGKIKLTYGSYATTEFSVTQSWSSAAITITPTSQDVAYTGGAYSFDFAVTNPREGASITAVSQSDWIIDVELSGNTVSYKVAENNSGSSRLGKIKLTYGSYATKEFDVSQSWSASSITTTPTIQMVTYTGGSFSFDFEVINPREGISATAVSQSDWITDVKMSGNSVSYKIAENSSGISRSGKIKLAYGGYATKLFTVSQSWSAVSITTTSSCQDVTHAGGSFSFGFTVINPREGVSVTAVSQSDWITDVQMSENLLSYKVLENDAYSARNGSIELSYGSYASYIFQINQAERPPIDLSETTSSNCYIVSSPGRYKFKTVKGNSSISVGEVKSVQIVWESFGTSENPNVGDLINGVTYADNSIFFETSTTFKNGNAVIAAKNSSGVILWSWHIWICRDYDPIAMAQEYYNNAGTMMDRNLGATSATPGDIGALGLLYQWGRKDPFLGSSSISSNTQAASTLSWPSPVNSNSSNGTIDYSITHPTTFIMKNNDNNDWYYTGESSTDETRWRPTKTMYDPCPQGWRVPDGGPDGIWSRAAGTSSKFDHTWDSTNYGINLSSRIGSASTIWYLTAGYPSYSGTLINVGSIGEYWSCSTDNGRAYSFRIANDGSVQPSRRDYFVYSFSVRCQKE